jgi:4-hydroxybenzoate polyprenyltransferase
VGAWLAVRGSFSPVPLALSLAVLCWVAGFDVIYACQDVDFDRAQGLHSLPARLGIARALLIARALH